MSASRVDVLQRQETEPRSSVYKIHSWCLRRRQKGRARRPVAAYRSPLCVHQEALTTLEFCSAIPKGVRSLVRTCHGSSLHVVCTRGAVRRDGTKPFCETMLMTWSNCMAANIQIDLQL